ncbi:MAG: site-specific DNA-methyltransferase [Bacillus sp. (in: firmicutes)]
MANLHDYRLVRLDDLKEHPENPRVHPQSAIDKLQRSIESFGFTQPIIVSKDGYILAGHARKKAAMQAGLKEAPALFLDLEGDMADLYLIADNKLQEETDWDFPQLKDLFERLDTGLLDLELSGYTSDEIEDLMLQFHVEDEEPHDDDFDADKAVEEMDQPIASYGDLWQLGRHRLLVGDSTKVDDLLRLMNEKEADMIFTDPPYNVDYEGGNGKKIQNDKMENDKFYQFLYDAFSGMAQVTKPGGVIYVCHADTEGLNFRKSFVDAGFYMSQCLVWVKSSLVPGYSDYQWKHEPILYGWREGGPHKRVKDRKQTTVIEEHVDLAIAKEKEGAVLTFTNGTKSISVRVPDYEIIYTGNDEDSTTWRFEKPRSNGDHPTMKPIPLCARGIQNSSKPGEIVLDPFGGSGSTLIAAQQTGRSCYTVEFDPIYASVIIERFEKFTGEKAIKLS